MARPKNRLHGWRVKAWPAALLAASLMPGPGRCNPVLHAIDARAAYSPADYAFLPAAVGRSRVVELGESIHVTSEMPRVRLNMLRYLHERMGFDVLAFEGSLVDAWTAQEEAYRSRASSSQRARLFEREALFGLWQTEPMRDVLDYAIRTQASPHPLYITSFDIQPGSSRARAGSPAASMRAFVAALSRYAPVDKERAAQWSGALGSALACPAGRNSEMLVSQLDGWIRNAVVPSIAQSRPQAHVAMLELVPAMLRARIDLCREWTAAGRSARVYQRARDEQNARMALAELAAVPGGKLVLWAHHSHIHYNSLGTNIPSMGQHLRQALGRDIYAIGVFAAGGRALDTSAIDRAHGLGQILALASSRVPADARWSVERGLAAVSPSDFFVDLRHSPAAWRQPGTSRLEIRGVMHTALSADFDGAVLLHRVTSTNLDFLPGWIRAALTLFGFVSEYWIALALALVLAAIPLGRRLVTRRRKAA
jgi:erythromycin esterase